tara:strand:- start:1464 stop:1592 length:129 start_codon:yes stop_codon:yes gene_type:complete
MYDWSEDVAELRRGGGMADALVSNTSGETRASSTLALGTKPM